MLRIILLAGAISLANAPYLHSVLRPHPSPEVARVPHVPSISIEPQPASIGERVTITGTKLSGDHVEIWLKTQGDNRYPEKLAPSPPYAGVKIGEAPIDGNGRMVFTFIIAHTMGYSATGESFTINPDHKYSIWLLLGNEKRSYPLILKIFNRK